MTAIQKSLLQALSDGKLWKLKDLIRITQDTNTIRILKTLVLQGRVTKIRRGVYALNSEPGPVKMTFSPLEQRILDQMSDGRPYRFIALSKILKTKSNIGACLIHLTEIGVIRRMRRGVYVLAEAGDVEMPLDAIVSDRKMELLEFLSKPRSSADVIAKFGFTRQAASLHLMKMVKLGVVERRFIGKACYYADARVGFSSFADVILKEREIQALNALPPIGFITQADLVAHAGFTSTWITDSAVRRLRELGYVKSARFGYDVFLRITEAGLSSPDYDRSLPHADPRPPISEGGNSADAASHTVEILILAAIAILGEAKAMDLRFLYPRKSVRFQDLVRRGFIKRSSNNPGRPSYVLCQAGRQILDVTLPVIDAADLKRRYEEWRKSVSDGYSSRILSIMSKSNRYMTVPEHRRRILNALVHGPMSVDEIIQVIERDPARKSMTYMILRKLRADGLVSRSGSGTIGDAYRYSLVKEDGARPRTRPADVSHEAI